MSVFRTARFALATAMLCGAGVSYAHAKPFMIVGIDEKVTWDDEGKTILAAPGKDSVLILDLANPEDPKIVATLPLANSVVGPPVNLDIDPSGSVALVADSVDVVKDGDALKQVPDNKIFVIDLKANPPKLAATVTGVKITDTITFPDSVAHVIFTPDGKHALVARFPAHKVSVLDVVGDKVTYNKVDLPTGQWPYNVVVTPDSKIALTSDNGNSGASDGNVEDR